MPTVPTVLSECWGSAEKPGCPSGVWREASLGAPGAKGPGKPAWGRGAWNNSRGPLKIFENKSHRVMP